MANIQNAIEYAKLNPNSSFANELQRRIESGQMNTELKSAGLDQYIPKTGLDTAKDVAAGFVKGAGRTALNTATGLQDIGQGALELLRNKNNTPSAFDPSLGIEALKTETPQGQAVVQKLQPTNEAQKIGGYAEFGTEILAGGGAQALKSGVIKTAKSLAPKIKSISEVKNIVPKNLGQKAIDLISADPEKKVQTLLKESTQEELSNYVSIAEQAATDPRLATPFEVVGNKLGDVTKTIRDKAKSIAEQKQQIIAKNDVGGKQFINEIDATVAKFQKLANKYPEAQKFVDALKGKVTKLDADTAIDDLQDILYTGSQNMTIPTGSRLAQQAKGILGEFNGKLKSSLPKEYTMLNDEYAKIAQHLGTINRSLGEVVDGVPLRGASLIKQFFSPSGTKAKEIFDFVKTQTNGEVDLAKDATLAKFTMELFDDPRARSLLQGVGDVPTTLGGVVSKVAEKVGGEKLQKSLRQSTIRKAKEITSPKSAK